MCVRCNAYGTYRTPANVGLVGMDATGMVVVAMAAGSPKEMAEILEEHRERKYAKNPIQIVVGDENKDAIVVGGISRRGKPCLYIGYEKKRSLSF